MYIDVMVSINPAGIFVVRSMCDISPPFTSHTYCILMGQGQYMMTDTPFTQNVVDRDTSKNDETISKEKEEMLD